MERQIIGIKQVYTGLKEITEQARRGRSFLVVKNSQPAFRIEPPDEQVSPRKKYTLKDFKRLEFSSGERNLSQRIDEIVYGV